MRKSPAVFIPALSTFLPLLTFCFLLRPVSVSAGGVGAVSIQNDLPQLSEQLSLQCGRAFPARTLRAGEVYKWRVTSEEVSKGLTRCYALWPPRSYLLWEAYERNSPAGSWSVREDGLYYSGNGSAWQKEATWDHD